MAETPASQRLSNDDFRKLLMTPRSTPSNTPAPVGSIKEAMNNPNSMPPPKIEDKSEARRKKKSYYAKLKKQEDNKMAELAEKYRDRASERRSGVNPDYQVDDPIATAQAYRAVAPDLKSGFDAAERRRQMIQESKFLGGDMEHTHLVKGLDYALLQKVRSEITQIEQEQEIELERLAHKSMEEKEKERKDAQKKEEEEMKFKTKIGRSIYHTMNLLKSRHIERSELFIPGRMAYVIDLDEEADSDIPTTLIRSVADVPSFELTTTVTTNDIVISKLTQILSYLRLGSRKNKKNKKGLTENMKDFETLEEESDGKKPQKRPRLDDSIYEDIGDYVPPSKTSRHRDREGKRQSYFDKHETEPVDNVGPTFRVNKSAEILTKLQQEPEGYAECYPGLEEMNDAIDDSDDEVDYSKMDLGNKKGPIGRWDFDTAEEYSDYMNQKEALPKAAFQYGLKMADGRRSRKHKDKNEKAHLDREWQKIQNMIQKKK
ncbi:IC cytokine homolog beag [Leptinotarsa decemlineata]|uniref:IC cytokine homolog beag n=1 Tax=Leptinotarsa decemlineata TaxID=7539 RepID=UPI000C254A24|nr:protein Red [Leptinotarsa decemlineata]